MMLRQSVEGSLTPTPTLLMTFNCLQLSSRLSQASLLGPIPAPPGDAIVIKQWSLDSNLLSSAERSSYSVSCDRSDHSEG